MKPLSSLTNRIFMASALLAVLSISSAIYFVNTRVTRQAEAELERGLDEAGTLVDLRQTSQSETFTLAARLIADVPKLKAVVDLNDPPTVQPLGQEFQRQLKADLLVITHRSGNVLAAVGLPPGAPLPGESALGRALAGQETTAFWPSPGGLLQVVTVPIAAGPEILGSLSVGFVLDDALAAQFKSVTESEIAFAMGGRILAATLPKHVHSALAAVLHSRDLSHIRLDGDEYEARLRPLLPATHSSIGTAFGDPTAIILRSRTERLRFLKAIHTGLAVTALFAVALATLSSYAIARTVTRPLAAITATMREMSATGDLTRKIKLSRTGRWDDEDARLLATTFNTLTDSIARFQREAAQRERLSSLGRLSTVVAHEIRNPLMIIKASLRTLRREDLSPQELREAVGDIDEEVSRLNRIVNEVLDFARPIKFDYAPTDVNAVCEDSAAATCVDDSSQKIRLSLDPTLRPISTDAERLRIALVNILVNARHAVQVRVQAVPDSRLAARPGHDDRRPGAPVAVSDGEGPPDVELSTQPLTSGRVAIAVRDRGIGIDPADLSKVFDPYFTTKRTGTGLGLAIAKNIVEGLGGTITVESRSGEGTEIRIELPASVATANPEPAIAHPD